jgi:hypothetical protein
MDAMKSAIWEAVRNCPSLSLLLWTFMTFPTLIIWLYGLLPFLPYSSKITGDGESAKSAGGRRGIDRPERPSYRRELRQTGDSKEFRISDF